MHCVQRTTLRQSRTPPLVTVSLAGVFLVAGLGETTAQTIIYGEDSTPLVAPALRPEVVMPPEEAARSSPPLLRGGAFTLRPHLLYRYLYADGVQYRPGQQLDTGVHVFAPGILLDVGNHWSLDYVPVWTRYTRDAFHDTFDQTFNLVGGTSYEDWLVRFAQTYATTTVPLIETAEQTKGKTNTTSLDVARDLGNGFSLETTFAQKLEQVETFSDRHEWSTTDWLQYRVRTGLTLAVGGSLGYVQVSPGTDAEFVQPQLRLLWNQPKALSLDLHLGEDFRRFLYEHRTTSHRPIFGGSLLYRAGRRTRLALDANRRVGVSLFRNQVYETTEYGLRFEQSVLGRLEFTSVLGYTITRYLATADDFMAGRRDHSYVVDLRLAAPLRRRANIALVYRRTRNSSNQDGFDFSSNQVGVELEYKY